jgi:hypothetical protein
MQEGLFKPQLHGYCHYNHSLLLDFFNTEEGLNAFNNQFFLAKSTIKGNLKFLSGECTTKNLHFESDLIKAQDSFFLTFGYYSKSFIPARYIIDHSLLPLLKNYYISNLQAGNMLVNGREERYYIPNFRKYQSQYWLSRNCRLDPHMDYNFGADQCIASINAAFVRNQPAVIDMHRVNFSGTFTPEYRNLSLKELQKVLNYLKQEHPDVIFYSSDELINNL